MKKENNNKDLLNNKTTFPSPVQFKLNWHPKPCRSDKRSFFFFSDKNLEQRRRKKNEKGELTVHLYDGVVDFYLVEGHDQLALKYCSTLYSESLRYTDQLRRELFFCICNSY